MIIFTCENTYMKLNLKNYIIFIVVLHYTSGLFIHTCIYIYIYIFLYDDIINYSIILILWAQ